MPARELLRSYNPAETAMQNPHGECRSFGGPSSLSGPGRLLGALGLLRRALFLEGLLGLFLAGLASSLVLRSHLSPPPVRRPAWLPPYLCSAPAKHASDDRGAWEESHQPIHTRIRPAMALAPTTQRMLSRKRQRTTK